jgi:hypothetical protein
MNSAAAATDSYGDSIHSMINIDFDFDPVSFQKVD